MCRWSSACTRWIVGLSWVTRSNPRAGPRRLTAGDHPLDRPQRPPVRSLPRAMAGRELCHGPMPIRVVWNRHQWQSPVGVQTTARRSRWAGPPHFSTTTAAAGTDWLEAESLALSWIFGYRRRVRPLPVHPTPRPCWFPYEYDWVFGCAYKGLPVEPAPILHVIGAAMAVRRDDLEAIGYFHRQPSATWKCATGYYINLPSKGHP